MIIPDQDLMNARRFAAVAFALLAGCADNGASEQQATIDHYLYYVSDLPAAAEDFASRTGIDPVYGGAHKTGGTANYLASVGDGAYLEILGLAAPAPETVSDSNELLTFAVRVDDIDETVRRLRDNGFAASEPEQGGRATPAGDLLSWRTADIDAGEFCDFVPFAIEWGDDIRHPATTSPVGLTVRNFEVRHPRAAELNRIYEVLGVSLRASEATTPAMQLTFATPKGVFVLTRKSPPCSGR